MCRHIILNIITKEPCSECLTELRIPSYTFNLIYYYYCYDYCDHPVFISLIVLI